MTDLALSKLTHNGDTYELKDATARVELANKQDTLISGSNIKTINNQSLLGSGNIDIQGGSGSSYTAGDGIIIENNEISVDGQSTNTVMLANVATSGSYADLSNTPSNFTGTDGSTIGSSGLVPAPGISDVNKFLKSDGTWGEATGTTFIPGYGIQFGQQIGGTNIQVNTLDFIDNSTIKTNDSYGFLQSEGVINPVNSSLLRIWEGTEAQWTTTEDATYYCWANINDSSQKIYTLNLSPSYGDTVFSSPNTPTELMIGSAYPWEGDTAIMLTNGASYSRDSASDQMMIPSSISVVHPNWLCNIEGVGVKIGNTLIANNTVVDQTYNAQSTNPQSGVAIAGILGNIETLLSNI